MAAPSQTGGDELMLPFAAAFLLVGAGLGACLLYSSHVNFTLVYRWALPLVVVGCGVLHVVDTEFGRSLAYLINFVALFGCQAICWIASAKHVRRTGVSPVLFFGGVVAAEGCGVTLGAVVGLWLSSGATGGQAAGFSLLIVGAVLLVTMLVGFKPCWISGSSQGVFSGDTSREATPEEGECPQGAAKAGDLALEGAFNGGCDEALQRLFARKARILGDAYGLTKREVEITAFLLAGRNRPYIRDELVISLHTVHTHVRNILGKCGVHSQQELIDLAHAAEVGRPALDMPAPPSRMGEASPAEARVSPPAPSRRLLTI